MNRKIKVLVISHAPWRNDTSIGNSYSNIFADMDDKIEFAQIYIRDGLPENKLVHKYFKLSEGQLLKSIFTRKPVGKAFVLDDPMDTPPVRFSNKYNVIRLLRWDIFLFGRDVASSLGKWKTRKLDDFIDDFKPDIIFGTLGFIQLVNQLMIYAKKRTGVELIAYPWDDWYHINRNSHSLFYFMRIHIERYYIKKCVENCRILYTITEQMCEEYMKIFNKKCKVLRKGYDFKEKHLPKNVDINNIGVVYAGNIGEKRWEILGHIAKAIKAINSSGKAKMFQYVYTLSPVNDEIKSVLDLPGASRIMGSIPSSEVSKVMDEADILIHVEPIDKVRLENCRLSFSTKIVDYLFKGKCILAVGGQNASMKYLKDNDAALVVDDLDKLNGIMEMIVESPAIIYEYGEKAWNCGKKNHDINAIQEIIYQDFLDAIHRED